MNILTDPFLTVRYRDGTTKSVALAQIANADIVDFALPRADFTGAAYQFAISVLQTTFAPEDLASWEEYYHQPPTVEVLEQAFLPIAHAFNLLGEGPLFMQDLNSLAEVKELTPVSALLIEAPGGNTLKNNTDHFIKRGLCQQMGLPMAALALYTLQINAPAGGQGHRTGIRGGGPLTTLIKPHAIDSSLWQKLWLNVLSREEWDYAEPDFSDGSVFPWLAPTRVSKADNTEVYAEDVHPLHMLWAMPRRIRLAVECRQGRCDLSGDESCFLVKGYKTQNYGYNYSGSWWHPLTHYRTDPKKPQDPNLSTKGQPGGITYQQWLPLLFNRAALGNHPAKVIAAFDQNRFAYLVSHEQGWPRLWAFGYDMDNMKARGWYSVEMPIVYSPAERRNQQLDLVSDMQALATETLKQCRALIKAAWSDRPGDLKGDFSFIDLQFYQHTEKDFFSLIADTTLNCTNTYYTLSPEGANRWRRAITNTALNLFDALTLDGVDQGQPRNMKRIITQRRELTAWLNGVKNKPLKQFKERYLTHDSNEYQNREADHESA